jgi:UDPglucose--hexose-1-phosphate uridylyltransferase
MMTTPFSDTPHRRLNQLTGEYVLVSPHRAKRPWQGKVETVSEAARPEHDASCYLCPGNTRANGEKNPDYKNVYVFQNDFAALLDSGEFDSSELESEETDESFFTEGLLTAQRVSGTCRVICFSPKHHLSLAELSLDELLNVISVWQSETLTLGERYAWVQIFENKGELMGCSNPHPHGQIWAINTLPNEAAKEQARQKAYHEKTQRTLLQDYLLEELKHNERVVLENAHWAAVVPFWAAHPFETLLIPKAHRLRLPDLTSIESRSLAAILSELLVKYDNLFQTSFPYSMGWHQAPFLNQSAEHWQLHAHFYPPLLRSATVKKFIVGYELLAEIQRDFTPEQAAAQLNAQSGVHYKKHHTAK